MTKLDFLIDNRLMGSHVGASLATEYEDHADRYETNHAHEFWNGRLLCYRDAPPAVAHTMRYFLRRGIDRVREFYGVTDPLYADVLHLVGWPPGMSMPVHADNCQLDGSTNHLEHREFSGVYYLTGADDGALILPNQGLKILPRAGRFVSLPCGLSHQHGVEVTNSLRITMAFFLTRDASKADPALMAHV